MSSESLRGASVLVTGAQGFIGQHVMAALDARGAAPVGLVQPGYGSVGTDEVAVDLEDRDAIRGATLGVDAIVHLAARSGGIQFQEGDVDGVFEANRAMTDNVLAGAGANAVDRVFLASSIVVYRPSLEPLTEEDPIVTVSDTSASAYARSKAGDEAAARQFTSMSVMAGRFGNVYGPGGSFDPARAAVVHALIERAVAAPAGSELEVWGDGSAVRSFVFVEDVASAVVTILAGGEAGRVYNVDGGIPVTIAELAATVRDVVDPSLTLRFDPTKPVGAPYRVPAIGALRGLGYEPQVDLIDGITRTVDWFRSQAGVDA